jgi:hypothetical protein
LQLVIFIINWESFLRLSRKHTKMYKGYLDEIYMKKWLRMEHAFCTWLTIYLVLVLNIIF